MKTLLRSLCIFFWVPLLLDAAIPQLHVDGKYFKDPAGNVVILRGVALIHVPDINTTRPGYQFMIDKLSNSSDGWQSRIIRIGVRTDAYLANPTDIVNNHLKPAVDYCTSKGLYAIIDWHYVADARALDSQTRQFWNDIAPRFANYQNVFYEVFNEHSVDSPWSEWKALAQPWINLIRSKAPQNIILMSGPFYSQHPEGAATDPFTGSNIAYVAHMYPGGWYPLGWDGNIGVVADVHPVVVTEWGYNPTCCAEYQGTRSGFGVPLQNWIESKGISWTAWVSDYAWGPPMFNSDWTPNDFGGFAKDWLFNKRNSNQPTAGPAAPTGLAATAGHKQVSLSWNSVAGATSYNVKRATTSGGPYTTVGPGITGANYLDSGLANGTTYYYVVSAVNGGGESANSSQKTATPGAPTFTSSATATPITVAKGVATTINAVVNCNSGNLFSGIVDLELYNSAGAKVGQQFWTGQNFNSGQGFQYPWTWSSTNTDTYTVKIGVFNSGWVDNLHWNGGAATVKVVTTAIRHNSGGPAAGWFSADANFSGGTNGSTTAGIITTGVTEPAPASVYQTERYGAFTYTIPGLTAGAAYTVRLHFAEIYWTAAGQRKFHVNINGVRVLTDFDIFAGAGTGKKAVIREFTATANSSGQLVVQYLHGSANNPQSSGIEIIR